MAWLSASSARVQPGTFNLTTVRKHSAADCTSGYLAVNGDIVAYTLEPPWEHDASLISSLPDGTYRGVLRYDHADKWRIELSGVPGRGNIQVHTGNSPDDTDGCILVGSKLGRDLCSIQDSKKAYETLRIAFYGSANPVSTPNKAITVYVVS